MFKRYALALALTAVAILLTALLSTMLARSIFLLYFIAVGAIAWRAGLVPALASTAVFIATALLLRFPRLLAPTNTRDVIRVLAWGTIAALFSWLMSYKRRSDARRRANEELYHAIMARESDGIIITDSDGMVLEANAGALAMLGYAERELIGKRLADLIPTEDGAAAGLFSVGLATQSRRLRRNDGAYIPVEGTGSRISATRFLSIFRDMSERERISEALTSSERKLRLIAEHTVDVIYAFDMERRPIYVNSAFEHSTGYRIDELHAGSLPSILHPDDRERWSLLCDRVFSGHGFQNEEVRIITRDGQVRWLLCSWGPIHDEEGRQIGVQGRDHDITARRQTEHALRQSEERLRLAQRAADAGVWEWDVANHIVRWSDIYYELYGLDPAQVTPSYQTWLDCILPEDRERVNRAALAAVEQRADLNVEFRIANPRRGTRWIAALGRTIVDDQGRVTRMAGLAMDITSRKETEEALRESEERLRLALIAGNVGVWDWDILRDRVEWSEPVYAFHGVTREEFDGTIASFSRMIHPDDFQRVREAIDDAIARHATYEAEFRTVHPTGEVRWLTTTGRTIYDEEGKPVRMLGATADITARKSADAALQESRERLRMALAAAGAGTYRWDIAANRSDRDEHLEHLFGLGLGPEKSTFEGFVAAIHPEDREAAVRAINDAVEAGHHFEVEYRVIWPDASVHWLVDTGRPFFDEAGKVTHVIGACLDITAWKSAAEERLRLLTAEREAHALAEKALRRSSFLAEASAILASSLDRDTPLESLARLAVPFVADYCVIFEVLDDGTLTDRAVAHAEPEKEPLIRRVMEIFPISARNAASPTGIVMRTGEPLLITEYSANIEFWREQDPELAEIMVAMHPTSFMILPIAAHGRMVGLLMLGLTRDGEHFTPDDLALGEDLARRAATAIDNARLYGEARDANAAKDRFLAVLSHELRTPLTPALAAVHALRDDDLPADLAQLVEVIGRNIELEARLIDDLLDLTRIIKGKLSLDPREVSVHSLLQSALEICRADIRGKRLMVVIDLAAGEDLFVGDAARLQQVFWNLLKNAVKFTPAGGHITIATRSTATELEVTVADSGIGIPATMVDSIFDAFVQGESEAAIRREGLGLGLAITRSIVEMHGGTVRAASPGEGQGAAFTVTLPLAPATAGAPRVEPAPASIREAKVLVIDDHRDGDGLMRMLMERRGLQLYTAFDPALVGELAEHQEFDIVVGSMGLGQGADSLLEELRRSGRQRMIVVSDAARALDGAHHGTMLIRPVTASTLHATIDRLLG